jgi:hypothetical protein
LVDEREIFDAINLDDPDCGFTHMFKNIVDSKRRLCHPEKPRIYRFDPEKWKRELSPPKQPGKFVA